MATLDTQYHCTVKSVGRAAGRSAVAAAAYRAGARLEDPRTGETHDYRRRGGVVHAEIIAPPGCEWAQDRQALWGAVETAATRKNSRLATEVEVALPAALTDAQRLALVRSFTRALAAEGVGVDFAIHAPPRRQPGTAEDLPGGSGLNWHAHILCTHSMLTPDGPSKTVSRLADGADAVTALRARWAEHINAALSAAGLSKRQDHRSYRDQGVDQAPTRHLGPTIIQMERRQRTERGNIHRARTEHRRAGLAVAALTEEEQRRARHPLPTAREAGPPLTPEQRRRRAEGYKLRLLRSRYGPLDDLPALAAQVRSLDLQHDAGPRVRLHDGATVADHGDRLTVAGAWRGRGQGRAEPSDAAIAALVTLARARGWQGVTLDSGSAAFRERAARAAARAGLVVGNDDLARTVEDERRRMQEEERQRVNSDPPAALQRPVPLAAEAARALADAERRGEEDAVRAARRTLDGAARVLDDRDRRRVGYRLERETAAGRLWTEACATADAERAVAERRVTDGPHQPVRKTIQHQSYVNHGYSDDEFTPSLAPPGPGGVNSFTSGRGVK
ncbi:MobA/MobL family protein [Azospirillum sp. RWY-5-1]|uniref:MobA/MobL family protein n=1 Tax=Azospirillum oleiclasticum TaxID=2735135 RepID=A0ABX2T806_9PROT|nr:MobA/MobL family protein [Azospirillum oleiclasticum]NYZ13286.1 MobA/MobL family protein [Azospirillum oleiclasticum]NYZ20447.1 MobA/MobL family protein [Azospirillum oleiclasticum]